MDIQWKCSFDNVDHRKHLEDLLPPDYRYQVTKFKIVQDPENPNPPLMETQFEARVYANVCHEQGLSNVLMDFSSITDTAYNQQTGDRRKGKNVIFSGSRKCVHNVRKQDNKDTNEPRKDKTENKNCDCPANVTFQLKKSPVHHHDENCDHFSLRIDFNYVHNHPIKCAEAYAFSPVSNDTRNRFLQYFEDGESPSSAYRHNKAFLKAKYKEEYPKISSNRSYAPDYKWVYNFSSKFNKEKFGRLNGPESIAKAIEYAKKYNTKHGEELCHVWQRPDGHYIVIIHEPMTNRVHSTLPQAGDIVFIDSTSSLDRVDSKYFRLLTVSPAGGLPLGAIITSSESEEILTEALTLFKNTLPSSAFYHRGPLGPALWMTDDCSALINSLAKVWPSSKQLLCTFHLLQAVWRWLWSGAHQIHMSDRKHLINLFQDVVYARSSEDYENAKRKLFQDDVIMNKNYEHYLDHLDTSYFGRKEAWALSVRYEEELPTHNCNTNNYCESAFRVLKDQDLNRIRRFNLPDLLDFFLEDESSHYRDKLVDLGNGRRLPVKSRYEGKSCNIPKDEVCELEAGITYMVKSQSKEDKFYLLDMRSGYCQCSLGCSSGPCPHKNAVQKHYNIAEFSVIPTFDQKIRRIYHFIALGFHLEDNHYRSFKKRGADEDLGNYVREHTEPQQSSSSTSVTSHHDVQQEDMVADNEVINEEQHDAVNDEEEHDAANDEEEDYGNGDDDGLDISNDHEDDAASDEEEQNEEKEKFWEMHMENVQFTKQMVDNNWKDENFKKAFISFVKKYKTAVTSNPNTFVRNLYTFGNNKNMKNSRTIPLQSTAVARRAAQYKAKGQGRTATIQGRRPKEVPQQSVPDPENDGLVYHTYPTSSQSKKRKVAHSLGKSIDENRQNAR